jgi:DNA-directed RNA polymerase subunit H (RpoH/RPB5)
MIVKYHQLCKLKDMGYIIQKDEQSVIDKYDEIQEKINHLHTENDSSLLNSLYNEYYKFAIGIYEIYENRKMTPEMSENNWYTRLSGIYKIRPDYEHYTKTDENGIPNDITLVWYSEKDKSTKSISTRKIEKKLQTDDAVKIISYINKANNVKINNIITISNLNWGSKGIEPLKKSLDHIHFQFYLYSELMYNPTKHFFVPIHRKLKNDEIKSLIENDGIDPYYDLSSMIYIDAFYKKPSKDTKKQIVMDPICKWYNFKPGDVIEITRINFVTDTDIPVSIAYRIVKKNIEPR